MCGIAGFTHWGGPIPASDQILRHMCDSLAHRGPDGQGYFQDQCVSLGHRRLAIIDLAGGTQPMANEDRRVQVVFNGEIYNFHALRQELHDRGHSFASQSDTEVLVHGWEEWGPSLFSRLNGMFALALYDAAAQRLVLARDRLGKKPLHYSPLGQDLVFASEIKSLLAHPDLNATRRLNLPALAAYLSMEYVPSPQCLLEGVRKLRAGHYLVAQAGQLNEQPYWDLAQAAAAQQAPTDFAACAERFWELLAGAVGKRLISDVPLGIFLSGGLDSLAVALAAVQAGTRRVQTFSIGFAEASFDESPHAQAAAQALGTDHHREVLSQQSLLEVLPRVLAGMDEPLADASLLPTYLLCASARKQVTVALSGDGADELLGGYPTFQAHRLAVRLGRPLGRVLAGLAPLARFWPVSHRQLSWEFRLKWFLRGLDLPAGERLLTWLGAFNSGEMRGLLTPEALAGLGPLPEVRRALAAEPADFKSLGPLSALYVRTYLENDILVKVDRASMLNSLEVRCPFLDHELVAFLAALPDEFKLRPPLGGKALLKQALGQRLPPGISHLLGRPKQGFGVPISAWLLGPLRPWAEELLDPNLLRRQGLFSVSEAQRLWREHLARQRDHRKLLWTLLMFQAWWRRHLDNPAIGEGRA